MKKLLPLVLGLVLAVPAAAQRMGSTNANAPTISQKIDFADGSKLSCEYLAITWASGRTMTAIMDKEKGERTRTRVNGSAKDSPLGEFSTSSAVTVGGTAVPAGEYKVYFTIDNDLAWSINLAAEQTITIKLPLQETPMDSKRLLLGLYAGEGEAAGLYVAFGKHSCDLPIQKAKAEKKDADK